MPFPKGDPDRPRLLAPCEPGPLFSDRLLLFQSEPRRALLKGKWAALARPFFRAYARKRPPRGDAEVANLGEGLLPTGLSDLGFGRELGFDSRIEESFRSHH